MDVEPHANIQYNLIRLNSTVQEYITRSLFLKILRMPGHPDHTQLNQHNDQIAACMDVKIPENNQCNNLKLSGNICNYLFQRTFP